jgi:transposase
VSWLISNSCESPKLAAGELICKHEKAMETQKHTWVAIDIAKEELQLQDDRRGWKSRYDQPGLNRLIAGFKKRPNLWVVCEASGGYERDLVGALHAASIKVCVVSPRLVRAFAISEGIRAKTDKIDTAVMLKFAQSRNLRPTPPPSKQRMELIALMDRRSQLSDALAQEKNHLQNSSSLTHASVKKSMRFLQREIEAIETKIKTIIAADKQMHRRDELMQSISGVGEMTSWSFIAYLDELAMLKRNEAVALVGLAPFNKDSGKTKGKRHIYGGRAKVRSCLYMAAQSAARYNPVIKPYVQRLKDKGKPYKCVMVAAMRKLVIHMHSQIKNLQPELA